MRWRGRTPAPRINHQLPPICAETVTEAASPASGATACAKPCSQIEHPG